MLLSPIICPRGRLCCQTARRRADRLATGPRPVNTPSAGGRDKNARLAFQLSGYFRLEPFEVADDPQGLVRFVPVDMNPRQLVPAVRAHGLQLGVLLQRDDRLVEAV